MASCKHRNPIVRRCVSTQTQAPQDTFTRNDNKVVSPMENRYTCSCFLRKGYKKASEAIRPQASKTINVKTPSVPRKTCTRCYSHAGNAVREPMQYTDSITRFWETCDDVSFPSTTPNSSEHDVRRMPSRIIKDDRDLTPKEIMNTWMPSREKPATQLLTPSDKYVDVSPQDFSLRKYFPEFFLPESEKRELRAKELEEMRENRKGTFSERDSKDVKCPQGSCGSKEVRDVSDWQKMVDDSTIQPHCSWSDRDTVLALERDEITDEQSNVKLQTSSRGLLRWFFCPCGKAKREPKPSKKKKN